MCFIRKWHYPVAEFCLVLCSIAILGSVDAVAHQLLSHDLRVMAFKTPLFNLAQIPRRAQEVCRSRNHQRDTPMRKRMSMIGNGENKSNSESDGSEENGEYFDLKDLLDDSSTVESVLGKITATAPSVPVLEDSVFKMALGHHCAIRTADILRAIKFYSLLGLNEVNMSLPPAPGYCLLPIESLSAVVHRFVFETHEGLVVQVVRFKAGDARCAFLEGAGVRLELIEVPPSMRPPNKAPDLAADMRSTGLHHVAFDVGLAIEAEGLRDMKTFLVALNRQSEDTFGMSVRLVVSPFELRIGQNVYELAFIMDADGVLLELLHHKLYLGTEMPSAW